MTQQTNDNNRNNQNNNPSNNQNTGNNQQGRPPFRPYQQPQGQPQRVGVPPQAAGAPRPSAPRPATPRPSFQPFQSRMQDPRRPQASSNNKVPMNENIRDRELRLLSATGEQLGIVQTRTALEMAEEQGLDLVVIGANQSPPVAKIMDYGKYKFEQEKQEKENRKKSKTQSVYKQVKLSSRIDPHDLTVKIKKMEEWILDGDRVQIVVQMKGREVQHPELAIELLTKILDLATPFAKSERTPPIKSEGRTFSLHLIPLS